METFIQFIITNWILLTFMIMIVVHRKKLLWEPLSGGNGHVQMDELAKGVIIGLLVFTVYREAFRENLDKQIFTDTFYLILLGGVFSIAALKPMTDLIAHMIDKKKE